VFSTQNRRLKVTDDDLSMACWGAKEVHWSNVKWVVCWLLPASIHTAFFAGLSGRFFGVPTDSGVRLISGGGGRCGLALVLDRGQSLRLQRNVL
jgi:hypothetical protein